MIYKIYPVSESKWLEIWKKIKKVCKQQGLQIVKIELEDYHGTCFPDNPEKIYLGQTTIIHLAEQVELFKSSNVFNISNPKSTTHNQRDSNGRFAKIIQNNP
jgi:hypothetical protein